MEDIEDLVGAGAPPGLRLPVTAVGIKPKRKPKARLVRDPVDPGPQVPGTQVLDPPLSPSLSLSSSLFAHVFSFI